MPAHPGGAPDEESGGVELDSHVGQLEGDGLVGGERPAELDALLRVVERVLEGGAADAEGEAADHGTGALERGEGAEGAAASAGSRRCARRRAEAVAGGHAAVLEDDVGGPGGADAHLLPDGAHGEAGRALLDGEGAEAAPLLALVLGGEDDVDVGDAAVGDEALGAVENVVVAVADGGGGDVGDVGAGLRLGEAVGAQPELRLGAHGT